MVPPQLLGPATAAEKAVSAADGSRKCPKAGLRRTFTASAQRRCTACPQLGYPGQGSTSDDRPGDLSEPVPFSFAGAWALISSTNRAAGGASSFPLCRTM